jgi:hypothetical protein
MGHSDLLQFPVQGNIALCTWQPQRKDDRFFLRSLKNAVLKLVHFKYPELAAPFAEIGHRALDLTGAQLNLIRAIDNFVDFLYIAVLKK